MPLQVSTGLSKKQGLPNYGSIGASCSVTFELDASLLHTDVDAFHDRVHDAFVACSQAVSDELACQERLRNPGTDSVVASNHGTYDRSNGNGMHAASEKQMNYAKQLARQIRGLGTRRLEALAEHLCGNSLVELSSLDASSLIDTLKAVKEGRLSLEAALGEGAKP